jgi:hypothetical protein
MSTPVPLRSDFDTIGLRMLARRSRDPDQTRRLLALAEIYASRPTPESSSSSRDTAVLLLAKHVAADSI